MKISKYNLMFEHKNEKLAFNSRTGALAAINSDFLKILNEIKNGIFDKTKHSKKTLDLINNMQDCGFIINDGFDELAYLEYRFNLEKFGNGDPSITILPTSACNCCCDYCFEGDYKNDSVLLMSDNVKKAIYKQTEILIDGKKNFYVTWFGGEPLLAKKDMWEISEKLIDICNKNKTNYSSNVITNAYLIDEDVIKNMIKFKVKNVHITLDGTPLIHDSIRKLHNGKGTFFKIIENAKKITKHGVLVGFGIHINAMQDKDVEDLLNILKEEGLTDCYISIACLTNYNNNCILRNNFTIEEYAKKLIQYQKLLYSKGFNKKYLFWDYPTPDDKTCPANRINSFVIDPLGKVYTCWPEIGHSDKCLGNIVDINDIRSINNSHKIQYMLFSPFKYKRCRECKLLPVCMGGCFNRGINKGEPECTIWKYNITDTLKLIYDNKN